MEHPTYNPARPATPQETAHYLADILAECEALAKAMGLRVLAYLIGMAARQAIDEVGLSRRNRIGTDT